MRHLIALFCRFCILGISKRTTVDNRRSYIKMLICAASQASIDEFIKFVITLRIRFFCECMAKHMFLKRVFANCVVLSEKTYDCDTFLRFDKKNPLCERSRAHLLIRSMADIDFNRQWVRECVRTLLCFAVIPDFFARPTHVVICSATTDQNIRMYNFELLNHSPAKKKDINFIL